MAEIVNSLFGIDPAQLQQQRMAQDLKEGYMLANLSPLDRATAGIYAGSKQFGRAAQGLLGMEDPQLQEAAMAKKISENFDVNSVAGLRGLAAELQRAGSLRYSQLAAQQANDLEKQGLGLQKTKADIELQERKVSQDEKLREALSKLPEDATDAQYLQVFRQFGSPDQQAKAIEASIARRERLAAKKAGEGDGTGVAGPVGKSGAYRDADGIVYSAAEMAKQRAGFQGLEKLADNLNSITSEDVKNAESFFDYTQGETLKTIGGKLSPKTISAQSKINASQLLKQIESLPPGSASNADMIAAKSSFPGYGSAANLDAWILDTKTKLAASMQRQSEQYGFKQKVPVKGLDGTPPPEAKGGPKTRTLKSGVVVTVEGN